MKSSKNFQKTKKTRSFDNEREPRIKKVGNTNKKQKNYKKEIYHEIDEDEELDLFGKKDDILDDEE